MVCDKRLVLELAGDIINALRDNDSVSAYRCVHALEGYVKRNKCSKDVIDAVIRLLESADCSLDERARHTLRDIISLVLRLKETTKVEETKEEKPKKGFKSHKQARHRR